MAKKKKQEEAALEVPRGYDDTFEMTVPELEELSARIRADMLQYEQDKQAWLVDRVKDVNAYFGIKKQTDWPFKGAAKISSQLHRIMVDTLVANLHASATQPEVPIDVRPTNAQSIEATKFVSDLNNTVAVYEWKMSDVLDRSLHNGAIESFVVLKPCYELKTRELMLTVKRWLPQEYNADQITYDVETDTVVDLQGQVIPSLDLNRIPDDPEDLKKAGLHECTFEITKEQVLKEGIKVYSIGGSNIFLPIWSPGETPFEKYQKAPSVIHQEFPTLQSLEIDQLEGKIKNFDLLRSEIANMYADTLKDIKYTQAGSFPSGLVDSKVTENLWWYGSYKYKGKFRELIVLMNRTTGTILKVQINQFGVRPFFPIVLFPIDGTPFGESLPKKIRQLVSEMELAMNTVLNMGMIKAYPPKFYDPSGGFDPKTLGNFGPNSYIPVRDPSRNIYMPQMPEDPRILMEMIKLIMDLVERTTANSDAVQGQVSQTANTTAFEVQQALVRSGVRFDLIYKRLRSQLEPMFGYIHQLLVRFMPYEKEVRIMGEQALADGFSRLYSIHKGRVQGQYDFTLRGNSITQEAAQLQKDQQMFAMFSQDPYISYKPESAYYLRYPLVQHFNSKLVEKILPKPEEVQELLRARQEVQNEQEALALADQQGALNGGMGSAQQVPPNAGPPTA